MQLVALDYSFRMIKLLYAHKLIDHRRCAFIPDSGFWLSKKNDEMCMHSRASRHQRCFFCNLKLCHSLNIIMVVSLKTRIEWMFAYCWFVSMGYCGGNVHMRLRIKTRINRRKSYRHVPFSYKNISIGRPCLVKDKFELVSKYSPQGDQPAALGNAISRRDYSEGMQGNADVIRET